MPCVVMCTRGSCIPRGNALGSLLGRSMASHPLIVSAWNTWCHRPVRCKSLCSVPLCFIMRSLFFFCAAAGMASASA